MTLHSKVRTANYLKSETRNPSDEIVPDVLSRLVAIPSVNPDQAGALESIADEGSPDVGTGSVFPGFWWRSLP